jgi:hypothetical protein
MAAYDINPLDEEEERKRREAIAQRMEDEAMGNPVGPVDPSFFDRVGTAVGNRFDNAMNRVSQAGDTLMNPGQAVYNRMMNDQREEQQQQAADTEVKTQTVKTYGDGSEERIVKTQVPAQQAQQPQAQQQLPQAQFGGMMGPVAPNSPEAQQQAQMFAEQMARSQQNRGLTTPIAGMPDNLPAQGKIPAEAANQRPVMAQLPQPGPAVRVAGQTQMPPQAAAPGASLAQAGAQAQARPTPQVQAPAQAQAQAQAQDQENGISQQQPSWFQAANEAGSDFYKLLDIANKNPESRDMISEKIKQSFKQQSMKDEADAVMKAAQGGDLAAQNKILQSVKPEKGKQKEEVTVNDYLKAVLYKRLGLDALAAEVQNKIIGKDTKFSQVTLGGSNWEVETNSQGKIVRAKDQNGVIATESTLNKLQAGSQKFGTQATSFAGGLHTVPNAAGDGQDLVMPAANTIDPTKSGFIYMSGPKKGQAYDGTATPQPQSVGTSFQKALDKAMIDFKTTPSTAAAKAALEKAAILDPGDNSLVNAVQQRINATSPDIFNQVKNFSPSGSVADKLPADTAGNAKMLESLNRDLEANSNEVARLPANDPRRKILAEERRRTEARIAELGGRVAPSVGGATAGGSLAQRESDIKTNAAIAEARLKPPAEERGKQEVKLIQQQGFADQSYPLMAHISDLIKKSTGSGLGANIDAITRFVGVGTKGSQAIKQLETFAAPLVSMVPRFEGAQSDNDVLLYRQQAGDFANPKLTDSERLAALQGMINLLKIYDRSGTNDWTFGNKAVAQQGGKDGKGGKQKVVKLD